MKTWQSGPRDNAMMPFWEAANRRTRLALGLGAISLLMHLSSWFGYHSDGIGILAGALHLSVMALLFWLWGLIGYHHFLAIRTDVRSWEKPDLPPLPRAMFVLLAVLTLYLFVTVIGTMNSPYSERLDVRILSTFWMWLALATALSFDRVSRRISWFKQYQSARRA